LDEYLSLITRPSSINGVLISYCSTSKLLEKLRKYIDVFYNTVELISQISVFFLAFVQICSYILITPEYYVSAFPEYNVFSGPPLMGSVYIRLIFWRGSLDFFEPGEFLELLGARLSGRFASVKLVIWLGFYL
jgi:hypothetical protein